MQKGLSYGYFLKEDWEKRGLERGEEPSTFKDQSQLLKNLSVQLEKDNLTSP